MVQNRDPVLLGSSVMGKGIFYQRYKEYKAKQKNLNEK